MNAKEIQAYRQLLSELATKLNGSLLHDQREVMRMDLPDMPGGPLPATDEVLDSGVQEIEVGLMANEQAMIREVAAALARMDAGSFGRCETCGKPIPKSRLEAVPYARECIACAKKSEKPVPSCVGR